MEFEKAITLCGGYGTFQKHLFLWMIPIGFTFVFGVSSMSYVMPAAICDFKITKYQQGLIYSAIYLGMVPSGAIWGAASDAIGRKKTLILTCAISGIFEFLCSFSNTYRFMIGCKILSGCAVAGVHLTFYVYLSEFTDPKNRDSITMLSGAVAAAGYFLQPLIATFVIPLHFKYVLNDMIYLNSWKVFLMISSLGPIVGFLVSAFVLTETPKYLLIIDRKPEALAILKKIYVKNTKKSPESFPITDLVLHEDQEIIEENKKLAEKGRRRSGISQVFRQMKPLFQFPYLLPAMMSFAAQVITMGSYNSVRPFVPTLLSLGLGVGQPSNSTDSTKAENTPFCVLFESQELFRKSTNCTEQTVIDPRIYYGSSIVGLCVFLSFFPGKIVVREYGKEFVFLCAHLLSAACIFFFPIAKAIFALLIICIYSVCMQNCITISVALMIGRIPTTMRGVTVSIIMVCGRVGVIIGNQVLPVITNISCTAGFWTVALINLMAVPIIWIYRRQPNPVEDYALKAVESPKTPTTQAK